MISIAHVETRLRAALIRLAAIAVILIAMLSVTARDGGAAAAAMQSSCQTSFEIATDLNNPGEPRQNGDIVIVRNSGVVGRYTDGRFADYAFSGEQSIRLDQSTGQAIVRGSFTAVSPDGASSFVVDYRGEADLVGNTATGTFRAAQGTGAAQGLHARGEIVADYLGNFAFVGVDVGLC
jgi:hypothetical protein